MSEAGEMRWLTCLMFGVMCSFFLGCSDSDSGSSPPTPEAPAVDDPVPDTAGNDASPGDVAVDGTRLHKLDEIELRIPAAWKEVEVSGFLKSIIAARFSIPTSHGDAELSCSFAGGEIDDNVNRWIGQVRSTAGDEPKIETVKFDSVDAQWVDLRGDYNASFAGRPSLDDARVIAIAVPRRPQHFFLKLIGPRQAVAEIHDDFKRVVQSARMTK